MVLTLIRSLIPISFGALFVIICLLVGFWILKKEDKNNV
jgi:hypothetical protein